MGGAAIVQGKSVAIFCFFYNLGRKEGGFKLVTKSEREEEKKPPIPRGLTGETEILKKIWTVAGLLTLLRTILEDEKGISEGEGKGLCWAQLGQIGYQNF